MRNIDFNPKRNGNNLKSEERRRVKIDRKEEMEGKERRGHVKTLIISWDFSLVIFFLETLL